MISCSTEAKYTFKVILLKTKILEDFILDLSFCHYFEYATHFTSVSFFLIRAIVSCKAWRMHVLSHNKLLYAVLGTT